MASRSRDAESARVMHEPCPSGNQRAQGMPGVQCTRSLACENKKHTSIVTTGSPASHRHSLHNGFTAYSALSPATNSSCHRRRRIGGFAKPGRARKTSADLTPATGARTTRLHRTPQHRSSARRYRSRAEARPAIRHAPDAAASIASRPNVRDDGQRPSPGTEWLKLVEVICPTGQAKYF